MRNVIYYAGLGIGGWLLLYAILGLGALALGLLDLF